jgi:flagellar biosynthesis/type III secretory pathway protein FliH
VTTPRARVLPRSDAAQATPHRVAKGTPSAASARVIPRHVAEARAEADSLLQRARSEAQQILARAQAAANDHSVQQQARARADALCLVVGEALELRKRQAELSRNVLDRSIGFATLLAERLLGEELQQKPERIRALARQALKEAAGARQAIVVAHPRDASELRSGLAGLGALLDSISIEADDKLSRGHIRVETELGVIEADIKGQLERLAVQLKKLLQSHAPDSD